jgi:(p)ppGpp synthase/HD superfamily hydrolase
MDLERQISVQWDPERTGRHTGEIQVYCTNKPGLLASISKVCEKAQVNINRAEAHGLPDGRAMCLLEVAVRNVDEMTRLMKNLEKVSGVESVERPARH